MKSLIIFAGAGASFGISKEKYPMTLDFRKRLPSEITSSKLYNQLVAHLQQTIGLGEYFDIEQVLWELGRLNEVLEELTADGRFSSHLLTTNQIDVIMPRSNTQGQIIHSQFLALKSLVNSLQDSINKRVYNFYSKTPTSDELKRSWLPLFKKVANSGFERINIVTTNYDLVIESALQSQSEVDVSIGHGRDPLIPSINLNAWRENQSESGMLTKLHGSVDWKFGDGDADSEPIIRRGHFELDGEHNQRAILYPGFKGEPTREPFITFHNYFRSCLKDTSHLLFIGFAFRDTFINNIISTSKMPNTQIAVIDPAESLSSLDFLSKALHLKQCFGMDKKNISTVIQPNVAFSVNDLEEWLT